MFNNLQKDFYDDDRSGVESNAHDLLRPSSTEQMSKQRRKTTVKDKSVNYFFNPNLADEKVRKYDNFNFAYRLRRSNNNITGVSKEGKHMLTITQEILRSMGVADTHIISTYLNLA